jgi:hypothetical protein
LVLAHFEEVSMAEKRTKKPRDLRKQIVAKAIVDPAFRRKLLASPEAVFGATLTKSDQAAVERLRNFLPALDDIVTSLAGEVLCGGGGGCGGLA